MKSETGWTVEEIELIDKRDVHSLIERRGTYRSLQVVIECFDLYGQTDGQLVHGERYNWTHLHE